MTKGKLFFFFYLLAPQVLRNVDVFFVSLSVFCTHLTHAHYYFPYIKSKQKKPHISFFLKNLSTFLEFARRLPPQHNQKNKERKKSDLVCFCSSYISSFSGYFICILLSNRCFLFHLLSCSSMVYKLHVFLPLISLWKCVSMKRLRGCFFCRSVGKWLHVFVIMLVTVLSFSFLYVLQFSRVVIAAYEFLLCLRKLQRVQRE